jgi:pyrrolysine biosynthesis protein PylC
VTVGIVGGRLQGLEAAYLAGKAGWRTRLVDKQAQIGGLPAAGLCGESLQADASDPRQLDRALAGVDLVLPALENGPALAALCRWAESSGVPLAFDLDAWRLTASKRSSNELIARLGVPMPRPWPDCPFPVVAKPDTGSGSEGVQVFREPLELQAAQREGQLRPDTVLQEFLSGPSHSLEVVGRPGSYRTLQVTDLGMDRAYDCKRVQAPSVLDPEQVRELEQLGLALTEGVGLHGLMDVEVILHEGTLKVLEIDARLPSQTPTAVYWSRGINMLEELAAEFVPGFRGSRGAAEGTLPPRGVVFEHLRVHGDVLEVGGEHLIAGADGIRLRPGLFGADDVLSNYAPGRREWVATLIVAAVDLEQAWARRWEVIQEIMGQTGAWRYRDPEPEPAG